MTTRKTATLNVDYFHKVLPNFNESIKTKIGNKYNTFIENCMSCCGVMELTALEETNNGDIAKAIIYARIRKKGMLVYYGHKPELDRLKPFGFKIEKFFNPNSNHNIGRATLFLDTLDVKSLYTKQPVSKVRK